MFLYKCRAKGYCFKGGYMVTSISSVGSVNTNVNRQDTTFTQVASSAVLGTGLFKIANDVAYNHKAHKVLNMTRDQFDSSVAYKHARTEAKKFLKNNQYVDDMKGYIKNPKEGLEFLKKTGKNILAKIKSGDAKVQAKTFATGKVKSFKSGIEYVKSTPLKTLGKKLIAASKTTKGIQAQNAVIGAICGLLLLKSSQGFKASKMNEA